MKRIFYCAIALVIVAASACSPLKKAESKFETGEYETAIDMFGKLSTKRGFEGRANYYIAESYRRSNRIWEAAPFYHAAIQSGFKPDSAQFYYGFALKARGEYDEAREVLESYLASAEDEQYITLAHRELTNMDALTAISTSTYQVENAGNINTEGPEYSPFVSKDRLYFTGARDGGKLYKATGTAFHDIYVTRFKDGKIDSDAVKSVGEFINTFNVNEGTIAVAPNGKTIIFGRGNSGKKRGTDDVNLYISRYRNKKWSDPKMMTISNPKAYDAAPAFSRNGRTLYFASSRPGGFGGVDIYVAHLGANGRWGKVKNMGPTINTSGNDMFPHVSEDGKLYFSSDGHPGFGGLDVYEAHRVGGKIELTNLGRPVNSNADDFGLILYSPNEGFFSSNRKGGKGDDDLYKFVNNDPNLRIVNYYLAGRTVTTGANGQDVPLSNVRLRMLDEEDNQLELVETDGEGKFKFRIDVEQLYLLIGEKPDYLTTRELYSTLGKTVDPATLTEYETDIVFDTVLRLDPVLIGVDIELDIFYDLDKDNIREDAAEVLDGLVDVLLDNPEIAIQLNSHTDSRADDDYNLELSQRRAQSAIDYIISKGVDEARLTAKGYGETRLKNGCSNGVDCTEAQHQENRRTEFRVVKYDKKLNQEKRDKESLEDRLFDDY